MSKVTSADGKESEVDCIGCALVNGDVDPVGEVVAETEGFMVQQDFEIPIPGFMILSSKEHLKGIEQFDENQRKEFIDLLYRTRKAMNEVLDVEYVYIVQEEDTIDKPSSPSHFHLWLFPRYKWMERFGRGIKSVKPAMKYARENMKDEENLEEVKEIANKIKEHIKE
ncbi:MAG: HIT family protein [Candidatus Aenigmatarchaeota archaeon]